MSVFFWLNTNQKQLTLDRETHLKYNDLKPRANSYKYAKFSAACTLIVS